MTNQAVNLSRRSFVQAAGATAAALGLAGAAANARTARASEATSSDAKTPADGTYSGTAASFGWTGPMT